jgi:hypothetical protein
MGKYCNNENNNNNNNNNTLLNMVTRHLSPDCVHLSRSFWEVNSAWLKFPSCYGTQRYITVFQLERRCLLYSSRSIQSAGCHPVSLVTIVVTSSHFRRNLRSSYFFKIPLPNLRLLFPPMHSTSPKHPWFWHSNNIWRGVPSYYAISSIPFRLLSYKFKYFPQPAVLTARSQYPLL